MIYRSTHDRKPCSQVKQLSNWFMVLHAKFQASRTTQGRGIVTSSWFVLNLSEYEKLSAFFLFIIWKFVLGYWIEDVPRIVIRRYFSSSRVRAKSAVKHKKVNKRNFFHNSKLQRLIASSFDVLAVNSSNFIFVIKRWRSLQGGSSLIQFFIRISLIFFVFQFFCWFSWYFSKCLSIKLLYN